MATPAQPQRDVRVKLIADTIFRERSARWREEARDLLEAASDYFEREFGIRFVPSEISAWRHEERVVSTALFLKQIKQQIPLEDRQGKYDLLIGLTGARVDPYFGGRARVDRIGNCQEGLGSYVVSSVSAPFRTRGSAAEPELDVLALIHELGHIFGAEHTKDTASIMNENFDDRIGFDYKNRDTVLKNKFCRFARSTESP